MKNPEQDESPGSVSDLARRRFLKGLAITAGAAGAVGATRGAWGGNTMSDAFADFFQQHYQRMSEEEIEALKPIVEI